MTLSHIHTFEFEGDFYEIRLELVGGEVRTQTLRNGRRVGGYRYCANWVQAGQIGCGTLFTYAEDDIRAKLWEPRITLQA